MISMIFLAVVLILIAYFFNKDVLRRDVAITIVTNLPLGIFKDNTKDVVVRENNENNIKVTDEEKNIDIAPKEVQDNVSEVTLKDEQVNEFSQEEIIVYWTPNGKSYHSTNNCKTLSRSKVIHSGNMSECDKSICCEQCKIKD